MKKRLTLLVRVWLPHFGDWRQPLNYSKNEIKTLAKHIWSLLAILKISLILFVFQLPCFKKSLEFELLIL